MNILRKITVAIAASLLASLLFTTGFGWSIFQVVGKADSLKTSLNDSGIYDVAISGALDQVVKAQAKDQPASTTGEKKEDIPVDREDIRAVIEKSVPGSTVKTQVEGVIDDVYAWLHGEKSDLSFTINLTDAKNQLADGLASYTTEHLATLPACPAKTPLSADFDPFTATCLPAGAVPGQIAADLRGKIANGEFLKDPTITADNLKKEDGKSLGEQLKVVPSAYRKTGTGIWASIGLMAVLATGVVFLSATWRKGLRRLSIILITVGGTSAVLAWAVNFGLKKAVEHFVSSTDNISLPLQQKGLKAAYLLSNDLRTYWMAFGLVVLAAGVATLLVLHFTKPKGGPADKPAEPTGEDKSNPAEGEGDTPEHEKSAETADKSKLKPRKLVQ